MTGSSASLFPTSTIGSGFLRAGFGFRGGGFCFRLVTGSSASLFPRRTPSASTLGGGLLTTGFGFRGGGRRCLGLVSGGCIGPVTLESVFTSSCCSGLEICS